MTDITPISGGCKLETTQGVLETKVVVNAAGVYADRLHNMVSHDFDTEVTDITPISGGCKLETTQGVLETKVVVNAAGVYADRLHNMVSHDPMTIVPRRGDYFLLDRSTEGFVRHTVFQLPTKYGKGVLVSPTVHGNTIVGPTAIDIEDKDCVSTTQEGLEQVRSKSGLAIQGLPLRQTITSFAGLRAHDVRHRFTIEETAPGFVDCAGIESPGLSCSPAIGEMVAGMVADILHLEENPDFDGSRKGIVNPAALPTEQRRALIASEPAYGNIICRCETSAGVKPSAKERSWMPSAGLPAPAAWTESSAAPEREWGAAKGDSAVRKSWRSSQENWASLCRK